MDDKNNIKSLAIALITQYGDDAQTVAMLRAAEFAAMINNDQWIKWEKVIVEIDKLNQSSNLDGWNLLYTLKELS